MKVRKDIGWSWMPACVETTEGRPACAGMTDIHHHVLRATAPAEVTHNGGKT